jgi:hypothetical protein
MPKKSTNDVLKARVEAAELLGFGDDPQRLCIADRLRVDLVVSLRAAIDHASASLIDGNSTDLLRLITATESLIKLLPERQLAAPESQRADPRQVMWQIYKQMRERGEIDLKADEGLLQAKIDEQAAEIGRLKAQLAGELAPALLDVPMVVRRVEVETAIDPPTSDIVPPGERAECDAGPPRAGLDDPPLPKLSVIEGKAVPISPKLPAARPPQTWDDTPNGKAWQAWHDGGGPGFDRWSNRNGA